MAFSKAVTKKAVEDIEVGPDEGFDDEALVAGGTRPPVAPSAPSVAVDGGSSVATAEVKEPEEEPEISGVAAEPSLDDQLLSGGGMELSDEAVEPSVPEPVSEASATAEQAGESPATDEDNDGGTKARLERVVGNGNPLSPNDQRKAAMAEKAAAQSGYGGGGGGIGALFGAAGSLVKGSLSLVGNGVKMAGGQKLADRFLQPSDPVSVAKRAFRHRYQDFDGAIKKMDAATDARNESVDRFNKLVSESAPGRTLQQMAEASNTNLHDFMSDVKSGKLNDPLALRCMESLERDSTFGQAAKNIAAAQNAFTAAEQIAEKNLTRLATDHGADINVAFENNRLVDTFEKAETDVKKPLPLEASLKDGDTGAEEKIDTEKQHKKFMEALEKIKESIAALLAKIMSKLGLGGPK